jgi:prepilin-type processing-associated H-X9-DG protein
MSRRRAGAFTLVELLTVLGLIVILSSLLLPTLAQMRERARRSTCLSQIHHLSAAHLLYLQDWDEQLTDWWWPAPLRLEPYRARQYWTEFLQPYLQSERLLRDSSYLGSEVPPPGLKLADYALGTWGPGGSGWPNDPYWRWPGPPLSLAQVRRPAETVSLTDGYTTTERARALVARHREGVIVSFLDGHAKWLRGNELYEVMDDHQGPYQHERWYFYRYMTANR